MTTHETDSFVYSEDEPFDGDLDDGETQMIRSHWPR